MATTHKDDHNNANDAINKIEAELGVTPSGAAATVAERLGWGGIIHAEEFGFTPYANATNHDTPMANLIAELNDSTPIGSTVLFPPGNFELATAVSSSGLVAAGLLVRAGSRSKQFGRPRSVPAHDVSVGRCGLVNDVHSGRWRRASSRAA